MTDAAAYNVGAYVWGAPTSPRALVRYTDLLNAYADATVGDDREAYLSHYAYGLGMQSHFAANRQSVAGFAGPCWCRWLVLDIDRTDLVAALADARKLAGLILERYGEEPSVFFSGSKGFHVLVDLAHNPPPSATFHRTARTFAERLAALAGVEIDKSIYDIAHILRLPNTKHPKTGLYKRRIEANALFALNIEGIRETAKHPAGDGIGPPWEPSAQLAADWQAAEQEATTKTAERATARRDHAAPDARAPRYFLDLLRFGVEPGERHATLFRCAAWLTEQGAPPSLVVALLTEPGCDGGLTPSDVARQLRCGIAHARKQGSPSDSLQSDPDDAERWTIEHEGDPLPPGALDFPYGGAA